MLIEAAHLGMKLGCCDLHVFVTSSCGARAAASGSPSTLRHSFRRPPVTPPRRPSWPARFGWKGRSCDCLHACPISMGSRRQFRHLYTSSPLAAFVAEEGRVTLTLTLARTLPSSRVAAYACALRLRHLLSCHAAEPAGCCPGRPHSVGEPVRVGGLIGICCIPYLFALESPASVMHMSCTSVARACTSLSELSVAPVDGSTHQVPCLRWAQLQPPVRPSFPFCLLRECLP